MTPNQIKDLRDRLRLSQAKFAYLVGAAVGTISRWETGVAIPRGLYAKKLEEIDKELGPKCG